MSEQLLLLQACRCADRIDQLHREQNSEPSTVRNHKGDEVAAPRIIEIRQQSITLARMIASLRLPDDAGERPQRRGGARGAYVKAVG